MTLTVYVKKNLFELNCPHVGNDTTFIFNVEFNVFLHDD